jgi:hypothetical protein
MSVARVAGMPDYTNSGASRFIPELWASKLIEQLYLSTVFSSICNTDYEGMIKDQGDTVIIRNTPTLTINDYQKGQKLNYERPETTALELLIDRGKYFAFTCDDIDAYQSDIKLMNTFSADAAEQMKIAIDTDVLDTISGTAYTTTLVSDTHNKGATAGVVSHSYNLGASTAAVQITKSNVLEYIVDCGSVLDEQNVPETGRWMLIPSWFANLIKKSDLKDASLTGEGSGVIRNGRIGILDRFTLYQSNNLQAVSDTYTCYSCLFGTNAAITFAAQMTKMETLRAESTFGDLVRGLNVYGFKVVDPKRLGLLYCRK